jgi:hypothetical protein
LRNLGIITEQVEVKVEVELNETKKLRDCEFGIL